MATVVNRIKLYYWRTNRLAQASTILYVSYPRENGMLFVYTLFLGFLNSGILAGMGLVELYIVE